MTIDERFPLVYGLASETMLMIACEEQRADTLRRVAAEIRGRDIDAREWEDFGPMILRLAADLEALAGQEGA